MSTVLPRLGRTRTTLTAGASLTTATTVADMQHDEGVRVASGAGGTISGQNYIGRGDSGTGQLPTGVKLQGTATDYLIERNVMRGFRSILPPLQDGSPDYWNADGFGFEDANTGCRVSKCEAYDCSDSGIDSKAPGLIVDQMVCGQNARNYRIWGADTQLNECVSLEPTHWGGSGLIYHMGFYPWILSPMTVFINRPIFYATSTAPLFWFERAAQVTVVIDSPVVCVPPGTLLYRKTSEAPVPIFVWKNSKPLLA